MHNRQRVPELDKLGKGSLAREWLGLRWHGMFVWEVEGVGMLWADDWTGEQSIECRFAT